MSTTRSARGSCSKRFPINKIRKLFERHGQICPLSFIFLPRHLGYPRVNVCISVQNSRICSSILLDDVFKLCVKTLFISENFRSYIQRLLCIVRNCIILSPSMYLLIVILKLHQFRLPLSMIF